jgi:hypothetical protein
VIRISGQQSELGKAVGKSSWKETVNERSKEVVKEKFDKRKTLRTTAEET